MSGSGRRGFCRGLWGLACLGVGACKIDPILDIRSEDDSFPLAFPELPPQIPDQLEDAETTLRALTEQLLERELPRLTSGNLRDRPCENPATVEHLIELMRSFGLSPAGNRGGWVQPVMLDIVETTGAAPVIALRPSTEAARVLLASAPDLGEPPVLAEAPDPSSALEPGDPDAAPPPTDPGGPGGPPDPDPDPDLRPPTRALELSALGAFRQRGDAKPYVGLLLGPVIAYKTPLPAERLAGHVVVVRAPKELDLTSDGALAQIDTIMSTVRDAGALGCLLLTADDGAQTERFRADWQRQVRRAGAEQAMLIEGLLVADARKPIQAALADEDTTWVLDLDLGTRSYEVESNNLLGRVTGRVRPDEAVVLTCHWDTPDPQLLALHSARLLATLGAFFQLAEWSRRSTPPPYSLVLVLTVDAGLAAGQSVHAAWSDNFGARTTALLALDRPSADPLPAVALSGHYDTWVVERARRVVAADGRALVLDDQLSMSSLAPYLRYPGLVMTIGAPTPEQLEGLELPPKGEGEGEGEGEAAGPEAAEPEAPDDASDEQFETLQADIRLLRNLMLALAARGR